MFKLIATDVVVSKGFDGAPAISYSHVIQEADAQASEQIADVMLRHRKKA